MSNFRSMYARFHALSSFEQEAILKFLESAAEQGYTEIKTGLYLRQRMNEKLPERKPRDEKRD